MANSGVLYMRGMNEMDSNDDMEEEDIWDDTKLNDAYDKALKMANLEVAKRVAMATNTGDGKKDKSGDTSQLNQPYQSRNNKPKKTKENKSQKKPQNSESKLVWKEGMPCRAMYSADGFDYEAILLTIIDEDNCVIRYLGYDNTEIVPMSSLQLTLGKQARKDQMMEALAARDDDASSTHSNFLDNELSEGPQTHEVKETPSSKRRTRRNKKTDFGASFAMPNMPMPDVSSMLREFGQMDMPTPPPPLMGMHGEQPFNDDQALSNMLVSWYMSGYYTGLYHGMKRLKQRHRNC